MVKKGLLVLLFFFCGGLAVANAQAPYKSPNRCDVPSGSFFAWTDVAVDPVGKKLKDDADVEEFLAPNDPKGAQQFDKAWMKVVLEKWPQKNESAIMLTTDDLSTMWLAARNKNFGRMEVKPCDTFEDMMYGRKNPKTVGRKTLYDPKDHKIRKAWFFQIQDAVRFILIEDCSNPTYNLVVPVVITETPKQPPPPETPVPGLLPPPIARTIPTPTERPPSNPIITPPLDRKKPPTKKILLIGAPIAAGILAAVFHGGQQTPPPAKTVGLPADQNSIPR